MTILRPVLRRALLRRVLTSLTDDEGSGPTITGAGSIDVNTFKIGTTQTITAGTATATGGGTVTYEYRHLAGGEVKSTSAAYAHVAGDDAEAAAAQWRAVESGGTNDGATSWQTVATGTITATAPSVSASDSLSTRTLTITVDTLTPASPSPTVALTTLTLDGVDVSDDATGTGPWSYVVPDSLSSQTVAWEVTATGSGGADTSSGSEIVAANLSAPSLSVAPSISDLSPSPGDTVTITEGVYTGTPSPTITGTLTLDGVDVSGDMSGADYTVPGGATIGTDLVWSETASNAHGSVGPNTSTATIAAAMAAPDIWESTWNDSTLAVTFSVDMDGDATDPTLKWALHADGDSPTNDEVNAGTGFLETGSDTFSGGSYSDTFTLTYDMDRAFPYAVSYVVVGAAGVSNVIKNTLILPALVADAFVDADWSVATGSGDGELDVTIASLPEDNGAEITDIEYDLDASGTWVSSGGVTDFTIPGLSNGTSYAVRLRAVNSVGNASAGNSESATSGGTAPAVPDAFVDANWSVATGSGAGEIDVTIASLPTNNGAAITDVEYDLDASGSWVSSGGTGDFTISGLTASTSYAVRLRAVNSVGNASAGNSESATSGASAAGVTYIDSQFETNSNATTTLTASLTSGNKYLVMVAHATGGASAVDGGSVSATQRGATVIYNSSRAVQAWEFVADTTGSVDIVASFSGYSGRMLALYDVTGLTYSTYSSDNTTSASQTAADLDVNTSSGDAVVGAMIADDASGTFSVAAGFDQVDTQSVTNKAMGAFSQDSAAGGTPETFTTNYNVGFKQGAAIAVVYS